MNRATIQRYQPGGDLYAQLEAQYGRNGALLIAQAATSGDRGQVTDAIDRVRYGERLDDSTARIFWGQITTDPFEAPLASANAALGTLGSSAILGLLKNPWVLAAVVLGVILWAGGGPWLGKQVGKLFK